MTPKQPWDQGAALILRQRAPSPRKAILPVRVRFWLTQGCKDAKAKREIRESILLCIASMRSCQELCRARRTSGLPLDCGLMDLPRPLWLRLRRPVSWRPGVFAFRLPSGAIRALMMFTC